MNEQQFREKAQAEGYAEPVLVEWSAGEFNDSHAHDFDAMIYVVEGSLEITCGEVDGHLAPGTYTSLGKGVMHTDGAGGDGVKFLAARR